VKNWASRGGWTGQLTRGVWALGYARVGGLTNTARAKKNHLAVSVARDNDKMRVLMIIISSATRSESVMNSGRPARRARAAARARGGGASS
jgi:hypothetical protein